METIQQQNILRLCLWKLFRQILSSRHSVGGRRNIASRRPIGGIGWISHDCTCLLGLCLMWWSSMMSLSSTYSTTTPFSMIISTCSRATTTMRAAILAAASVMTASSALATAFRHFSKYLLLKQSLVE